MTRRLRRKTIDVKNIDGGTLDTGSTPPGQQPDAGKTPDGKEIRVDEEITIDSADLPVSEMKHDIISEHGDEFDNVVSKNTAHIDRFIGDPGTTVDASKFYGEVLVSYPTFSHSDARINEMEVYVLMEYTG